MIVDQAIFGEVKGGHGLQTASGDVAGAAGLASRLDLPDTAPPGAELSPFVSGFPHGDRYVVARTFWDSRAARSGMVLSHALIMPLEDIAVVADLRALFNRLITEPLAPSELPKLELEISSNKPAPSSELPALAAALSVRGSGPIVRLGHRGFDELVASLWATLWPAIRRRFAFRLSFGPNDLVETPPPALVCTPNGLVARWQGHRLLDNTARPAASLAAAMLSGTEAGEPLRIFAESLGAEMLSFGELPLLEQTFRLATVAPDTIGNTVAAIRLASRLSPDQERGDLIKRSLLDRLIQRLAEATADDILPLRNLSLIGFEGHEQVWKALERWTARNIFPPAQDHSFMLAIKDATNASGAEEVWRNSILEGLASAAGPGGGAFASAFWRWSEADPTIIRPLWVHVAANAGLEHRLVQASPSKLKRAAAEPLLSFASVNRMYALHGAVAASAFSPLEAARLQVTVEPVPGTEGLQQAIRNATPKQLVTCAIEVADSRLIDIAAKAVAKTPSLMANLNMSDRATRELWSAALDRDLDAWLGPSDPRAAADLLLHEVLDGAAAPVPLLEKLSRTPLADLSNFPRRHELWSRLGDTVRTNLIRATAAGWLTQAEATGIVPSLETELQNAILHDSRLNALLDAFSRGRIGAAVEVVAKLSSFDEARFRRWLKSAGDRTRPIPALDAEAVGRLAAERRWHGVADELMHMLRWGRDDVRPGLRACVSLIGVLDRWIYNLSPVSSSEKWDSLESAAAELYPGGPDHDGLWERAGGHDADLAWGSNGRSRWRDALAQIRRGKEPRIDKLLREMQHDYSANRSLAFLAKDHEFGGRN